MCAFQYSKSDDSWSQSPFGDLRLIRAAATSHILPNGTLIFIGGTGGGTSAEAEATSDVLHPGTTQFVAGSELPGRFYAHCSCVLNETHLFVTGGQPEESRGKAYIMEIETGTWTRL